MFLLDTNVISELRKTTENKINPGVKEWAETKMPSTMFLSAITIFELELGILHSRGAIKNKDRFYASGYPSLCSPLLLIEFCP